MKLKQLCAECDASSLCKHLKTKMDSKVPRVFALYPRQAENNMQGLL